MPSRTKPRLLGSPATRGAMAFGVTVVAAALVLLSPSPSAAAPDNRAASEKATPNPKRSADGAGKVAVADKEAATDAADDAEKLATPAVVRRAAPPPDQTWLQDVPEKPGVRTRGKAAVFVIRGDEYYQPVRAAVVKTLRRRGLNVTATLRPVDSAAQYREMSQTLQLGVFIDGELRGDGAKQTARIRLRSGVSGRTIATAMFKGPTHKIVGDVNQKLWARMGGVITRSCSSAARQRRPERAPLRIEAGSPEDSPLSMRGA